MDAQQADAAEYAALHPADGSVRASHGGLAPGTNLTQPERVVWADSGVTPESTNRPRYFCHARKGTGEAAKLVG